jgi:hypothetical protein
LAAFSAVTVLGARILGPALGDGPLMERPADILKAWPDRASIQRQRPAEFNAMIDQLILRHCAG